ncbi:glycosyltransferase [Undibacter mobilis]|uniref:Uncharacterized protein n=1 Tax=Undibacter mobilis TaxID=2292256 RepID=A0A371B6H7_9BRAD|nr:glycosyltransferase [Undibacter mobilis]RDV03180.1 hypothetical protein DXH78_00380 [Undibacter mobilis]
MVDFPRLLFITPVAFNPYSGGGATFASLLQGWPKSALATIHNDRAPSPTDTCEQYFVLGPDELDFVFPFNTLRGIASARTETRREAGFEAPDGALRRPRWMDAGRKILLGDSIPERAHLTSRLTRWINDFRPDLIYTILGSNGMMSLIEQVRARFNIPLVVHIMDDWVSVNHRDGLFAPIERARMTRAVEHAFKAARTCLGISPAMCAAYSERYGRDFIPFQYSLDRTRWGEIRKSDLAVSQPPELLYAGSIFRNAQLDSLIDCAHAVAKLNEAGFPLKLRVATSPANGANFGAQLKVHPNIIVDTAAVDDDAFFRRLAAADALVLPVNFDRASVDFIRYSMPTKVPAYLNSGTPIFAYGSLDTAQIQYARDARWGLTVTERSTDKLQAALRRITADMDLRRLLSHTARKVAENHDAHRVRDAFQDLLRRSAAL